MDRLCELVSYSGPGPENRGSRREGHFPRMVPVWAVYFTTARTKPPRRIPRLSADSPAVHAWGATLAGLGLPGAGCRGSCLDKFVREGFNPTLHLKMLKAIGAPLILLQLVMAIGSNSCIGPWEDTPLYRYVLQDQPIRTHIPTRFTESPHPTPCDRHSRQFPCIFSASRGLHREDRKAKHLHVP